jgi:hypothetical protein
MHAPCAQDARIEARPSRRSATQQQPQSLAASVAASIKVTAARWLAQKAEDPEAREALLAFGSSGLLDFLVHTATEEAPSTEQQHAEQAVVRCAWSALALVWVQLGSWRRLLPAGRAHAPQRATCVPAASCTRCTTARRRSTSCAATTRQAGCWRAQVLRPRYCNTSQTAPRRSSWPTRCRAC